MEWNIILVVVGILALMESLFSLSFSKLALKITKKLGMKMKLKTVRKFAWGELVIAIIILLIGINI
jgi:hypothetical protein